ncbi:hypothetical protein [Phyllobacterium calauticae]|jgi:hypothetical protein|uniref:hypothetical protein n=1 Tax=Phyllobacterium calauticae TaxID=2817027 RepID=UPI001CC0CD47|nr:hypothetical protein [Phyllobacterium calauticae]MBZ3690992.1 hypothetical protein [Phyllobacterium calauticae]
MTKFNYERMQSTATRLLTRFNQGVVTLTRPGTVTPAPNPWEPPVESDPIVYTLNAVVKAVEDKFIDGTLIFATDRVVICSVLPVEVLPGDKLSIDGKAVTTIKTMRIPDAGVVVAWKFIVRG